MAELLDLNFGSGPIGSQGPTSTNYGTTGPQGPTVNNAVTPTQVKNTETGGSGMDQISGYAQIGSSILDTVMQVWGAIEADKALNQQADQAKASLQAQLERSQREANMARAAAARASAQQAAASLGANAAARSQQAYQRRRQNTQDAMQVNQLQKTGLINSADYRRGMANDAVALAAGRI